MATNYRLIVSEVAKLDIADAFDYYEIKNKGLGRLFLLSVKHTFKILAYNPFVYMKIHKEVRRALTEKFPYALFYTIDEREKLVTIYSVRSTFRNPDSWKSAADL
jgi:plasmid stabilization system protein ParE